MSNQNSVPSHSSSRRAWLIVVGVAVLTLLVAFGVWSRSRGRAVNGEAGHAEHEEKALSNEILVSSEMLKTAGIEVAPVEEQSAEGTLKVTGTVEADASRVHLVTPLVGGRVERVMAALGDRVAAGQPLVEIASPEYAERRGKLLEAETRLNLAERNFQRVKLPENRVTVLQAQARLDEAEANLNRTRKLAELGAGAGKDLTAAEATYRTAKAEYEFQNNVGLNREAQQAASALEEARADAAHQRESLRALGATFPDPRPGETSRPPATLTLRAPFAGTVVERSVNAGAGIEAGKALLSLTGLSSVWVIANVPESRVSDIRIGMPVEITLPTLGEERIKGRISYLEPALATESRSARARIEVSNPNERLKIGNFVAVSVRTGSNVGKKNIFVPGAAIQRIGERTVVFVEQPEGSGGGNATPTNETGGGHSEKSRALGPPAKKTDENHGGEKRFEVREVEVGPEADGRVPITGGLKVGERIAVKGAFILKTQLIKGELGHDD